MPGDVVSFCSLSQEATFIFFFTPLYHIIHKSQGDGFYLLPRMKERFDKSIDSTPTVKVSLIKIFDRLPVKLQKGKRQYANETISPFLLTFGGCSICWLSSVQAWH